MKKKVALIAGGDSGEYVISLNSAAVIKKNIDPERFEVYTLLITRDRWVYVDEQQNEVPVNKDDFSIIVDGAHIRFDVAFVTIHGTPGEDGKLQGYLDLMHIPYTCSNVLSSALTFNKFFCNTFVGHWGVQVARSVKYARGVLPGVGEVLAKVNLPVFVKPNKGGSSLGTNFVREGAALIPALEEALLHDDEALVEEYIRGTELTCGVFRKQGQVVTLPVTEIVSKSGADFFDYKAKYTQGEADEITPARISAEITRLVQETTAFLYEKLELKGICRIDFIYSEDRLFFLEANITPGMSERSIVPQQAEVAGIPIRDLYTCVLEEALQA